MGGRRLPRFSLFLLFLGLLATNTSAAPEPQYMLLISSLLHAEVPEKACILLSHLNETVTLSAVLEYGTENRSLVANLVDDLVANKDTFHCSPFTLPSSPVSETVAFLSVRVKGPTQEFRKRKAVLVRNMQSLVFVQTDKPIYKPGQTVRFRVVSVDEDFHPLNETVSVLYIEDPKRNRIAQWRDVRLRDGFGQFSFPLSSEPSQGQYKVVVQKESGARKEHPFTVEEFVLPKFEVLVKMPKKITILDEEIAVSVCGIYTYGKPVPGTVTWSVCRRFSQGQSECYGKESEAICEEFSQQADSQGCVSGVIETKLFQLKQQGFLMNIEAEATIREEGTELELSGRAVCEVTKTLSKITFEKVDSHFRRGLPFFGQVRLLDGKDAPIPNALVQVSVDATHHLSNHSTDEYGLVQFSIDTSNFTTAPISVRVTYKDSPVCYDYKWLSGNHESAEHKAKHVYSASQNYIRLEPISDTLVCGHQQDIRVHYILNDEALGELKELLFYYVILAKGGIVRAGTHVLQTRGNKGSFSVELLVGPEIAPVMRFLIYSILPDGEVVADSEKFNIEKCFSNKVELQFSSIHTLPGSGARLRVTASPQSLCALRALDQSVLLLKAEAELSPSSVYSLLPEQDLEGFPEGLRNLGNDLRNCTKVQPIIVNGIPFFPMDSPDEDDAYSFLKNVGLQTLTNLKIQKPQICQLTVEKMRHLAMDSLKKMDSEMSWENEVSWESSVQAETVRKYFPEAWIWELLVVDTSGQSEVAVTIPDTITEWKVGAFCLSAATGLGLAPTTSLRAFQPFFLELTLPYSMVRGEGFPLKATVFSYLPGCIRVSVQLEASPDFLAVPMEKGACSHCICGSGRLTLSWMVTPSSLGEVMFSVSAEALQSPELCGNEAAEVPEVGRKDTVIRTLLVEPEGIEKEETFNSLLCVKGDEVSEKISLQLPPNTVSGSARASFSILGDILGSALQNLQNLLQMPYGCGEQNMVLFAPNIYVLNYLNKTQQLTPSIRAQAMGYLSSGYQRQLNYKHQDGSYSTFGEHHGSSQGNTWLTAFVLKALAQARAHIFVDEEHISSALLWLSGKQKDNGCFLSSGSLLNNAIKGGVDNEVTLSAYITTALLEMPLPATHPVVRNALYCLETAWRAMAGNPDSHVYTKALLAYAFALAGHEAQRREVLQALDRDAVRAGGSIHWQRSGQAPASIQPQGWGRAPSAEVEMTAYVLLARLTAQPAPSPEDLSTAALIIQWIAKQQNAHGGFSSTQDTVVALHALAQYGTATFNREGKAAVTVRSKGTFSKEFHVEDDNRLLVQQVALAEVPGEYSATVTGAGCVYLQTSLRYNIVAGQGKSPIALQVQTIPQSCSEVEAEKTFQISISASYTGSRPASNMVIADVKMVSGFIPLKSSVKMLQESNHVSRTEVTNNHVLIYLEQLTNETLSLTFTVTQDVLVQNLRPAPVRVYDYYETDEVAIVEYSAPCSTETEAGNA
ncbi:alpha-2-macroglobulin isoform X2 [Ornithorhynchus anatinus]|uniref:alpha-2-macroglobulin isoform X2 n=1 Tax=Ornithorhynchus anatinus TaxID=9258 RepID=UPI0010A8C4BF|nr:alpha-2-macroglobulin isoform X2 [Ornithorhynchus anatinus]